MAPITAGGHVRICRRPATRRAGPKGDSHLAHIDEIAGRSGQGLRERRRPAAPNGPLPPQCCDVAGRPRQGWPARVPSSSQPAAVLDTRCLESTLGATNCRLRQARPPSRQLPRVLHGADVTVVRALRPASPTGVHPQWSGRRHARAAPRELFLGRSRDDPPPPSSRARANSTTGQRESADSRQQEATTAAGGDAAPRPSRDAVLGTGRFTWETRRNPRGRHRPANATSR
jgi:hypothetical protein